MGAELALEGSSSFAGRRRPRTPVGNDGVIASSPLSSLPALDQDTALEMTARSLIVESLLTNY
jgi:hypothetical protein